MADSFLQRLLLCLLWLGLGAGAAFAAPTPPATHADLAGLATACDAGLVDAYCQPSPRAPLDDADPMKRRNVKRRVAHVDLAPIVGEVAPVWSALAVAVVDEPLGSSAPTPFFIVPRVVPPTCHLRALRGRAPPDSLR